MQLTAYENNDIRKNVLIFFTFLGLALVLFGPVLHKNFASDDFDVLNRVVFHHGFFMKGFFRPLSDFTLYFSYCTGGFNPFLYNLFNVCVHAGSCFLLYYFCLLYTGISIKNRGIFAWTAACLFLIYPFHNESVVWVVGRASSVSCFCGFLSLVTVFSALPTYRKYFLACIFYFLGLCSYETILPLPCIVFILLYRKQSPLKNYVPVIAGFGFTLIFNLIIRYIVSGVIYGDYGGQMFGPSVLSYVSKFLKVTGRLLLPPSDMPVVIIICFAVLAIIVGLLSIKVIRKGKEQAWDYTKISLVFLVSCIVPLMFGINTRTFEGDRLFYFNSFFLCMWIAYIADVFARQTFSRIVVLSIAVYFLIFFYVNIFAWKKAGEITTGILADVRDIKKKDYNVLIINLPEEYNGAQVLRSGFIKALFINNIDTQGIRIINHVSSGYAFKIQNLIKPAGTNQGLFIYPGAFVTIDSINAKVWDDINSADSVHLKLQATDKIYYWNKTSLVLLKNSL
jgi:hypothetical protein